MVIVVQRPSMVLKSFMGDFMHFKERRNAMKRIQRIVTSLQVLGNGHVKEKVNIDFERKLKKKNAKPFEKAKNLTFQIHEIIYF